MLLKFIIKKSKVICLNKIFIIIESNLTSLIIYVNDKSLLLLTIKSCCLLLLFYKFYRKII